MEKAIPYITIAVVGIIAIIGLVMTMSAMKNSVTGNYVWWDTYAHAEGGLYKPHGNIEERYGNQTIRQAYSGYNEQLFNYSRKYEGSAGGKKNWREKNMN